MGGGLPLIESGKKNIFLHNKLQIPKMLNKNVGSRVANEIWDIITEKNGETILIWQETFYDEVYVKETPV